MPLTTATISGIVSLPNDTVPDAGSYIEFTLSGFDTDDGTVLPNSLAVRFNNDGTFLTELWPNAAGVRGTRYDVAVFVGSPLPSQRFDLGSIIVPSAGEYDLDDLLAVEPPEDAGVDEYIVQLASSVSAAESAASVATLAADDAANSAAIASSAASVSSDEAVLSAAEAAASAALAAVEATNSAGHALQAEVSATQALAAAEASGDVNFYDTKGEANAALGGLSENDIVEVMADESFGGKVSRYRVESAALVFKYHSRQKLTYIDARDFGVLTDGTDVGTEFNAAVTAALAANIPLKFPDGIIHLGSSANNIDLNRGVVHRWFSDGNTTLFMDSALRIQAPQITDTTLAADAAQFDRYITLTSVSNMEVGDLIHIDTDTAVETGWGYHKQCVRRISAIDGTTILLDQALDFWFTVAESTTVTSYAPAQFHMDQINVECVSATSLSFRYLCDSTVQNGKVCGQVSGWSSGWSDGFYTVTCDRLTYNNYHFEKLRYAPQITEGSRFITVKNCVAKEIRHMDANTWSQDILYENITGISTDGIIQCHPCIRPTWRNINDSVTQSGLSGVDLRGLGETVIDCAVHSKNGAGTTNTSAPLLKAEYLEMAATFNRRIERLRAPYSGLGGGKEGRLIVKESDVYSLTQWHYIADHTVVQIDDLTRIRSLEPELFSPAKSSMFDRAIMQGKRATVDVTTGYRTKTRIADITGVTRANPAVVTTKEDHLLATGDQVKVSDVSGMTELNGNTYTVTILTSKTYSLDSTNSSGFNSYTSNGKAALQAPIHPITEITKATPAVVTSAAHGYSNGDVVWINGVVGMTEVNRVHYQVASATANTFELTDLAGIDFDTSGFTDYTSGGKATIKEAVDTVDAATNPMCGIKDKLLLNCAVKNYGASGVTGSRYYTIPVKYRAFNGGNVDQATRWGILRVIATTNVGRSIAEYHYQYDAQGNSLNVQQNHSVVPNDSAIVTADNFEKHYVVHVGNEGETSWTMQHGGQHYLTFDVKLDVAASARYLYKVEVEFDEQKQGN
ncbi:ubiquitin-activating E1 FCCH domain-containing protein [Falsihalocynthiibacter sp. S25ZX9]|uniref:ubiquitin-activating E1 FCCH domain-containing protein n=1 Tax=Falsihalocynthiibacter sp. S25ZX9 TaxID=3240870 RepID=UPI00350F724B